MKTVLSILFVLALIGCKKQSTDPIQEFEPKELNGIWINYSFGLYENDILKVVHLNENSKIWIFTDSTIQVTIEATGAKLTPIKGYWEMQTFYTEQSNMKKFKVINADSIWVEFDLSEGGNPIIDKEGNTVVEAAWGLKKIDEIK